MYVVCVTIFVKKENVEDFVKASLDNATNTRKEPGNIRFDVLRSNDDETRFFLYEAYNTQDDFVAHQKTEHYLRWKATVADWMAQPRQGVKHTSVFFGDSQC